MELPEDIPHRAPPRHSIDIRHNTSSRHSIDISRAHSVRPSGAAPGQASQLARGSTSSSDNSVWDNISEENKGIIRQVTNASFAVILHMAISNCLKTTHLCPANCTHALVNTSQTDGH